MIICKQYNNPIYKKYWYWYEDQHFLGFQYFRCLQKPRDWRYQFLYHMKDFWAFGCEWILEGRQWGKEVVVYVDHCFEHHYPRGEMRKHAPHGHTQQKVLLCFCPVTSGKNARSSGIATLKDKVENRYCNFRLV